MRACVCVFIRVYTLRIVSTDNILRFISTLIMNTYTQRETLIQITDIATAEGHATSIVCLWDMSAVAVAVQRPS